MHFPCTSRTVPPPPLLQARTSTYPMGGLRAADEDIFSGKRTSFQLFPCSHFPFRVCGLAQVDPPSRLLSPNKTTGSLTPIISFPPRTAELGSFIRLKPNPSPDRRIPSFLKIGNFDSRVHLPFLIPFFFLDDRCGIPVLNVEKLIRR